MSSSGRPGSALLATLGVVLAIEAAAAIALLVVGLTRQFQIEAGPEEKFQAWNAKPLAVGGSVALVVLVAAGVTLLVWRVAATRWSRPGLMAGAVVGLAAGAMVALLFGYLAHSHRSHPQNFELQGLAALVLPAGAVADNLSVGPPPTDIASPVAVAGGPPTGIRTWTSPASPATCSDVQQALTRWADAGSVRVPLSFHPNPGSGLTCQWFATYRGWAAAATVVVKDGGAARVQVTLSPPGTR